MTDDSNEIFGTPSPDPDENVYEVPEPDKRKRDYDEPLPKGKPLPPYVEPRKGCSWPLFILIGCVLTCCACCVVPFCVLTIAGATLAEVIDNSKATASGSLPVLQVEEDEIVTLDVKTSIGQVKVEGWDRNEVVIDYKKTAYAWSKSQAQKELDDMKIDVEQPGDNTVVVRVDQDKNEDSWWEHVNIIDMTIHVPKNVQLKIQNTTGLIDISGVTARALDLDNTTGAIHYEGSLAPSGSFSASNTTGEITMRLPSSIYVRVDAQTTTGDIIIDDSFSTSDGSHTAEGPGESWQGVLGTGAETPPTLELRTTTGNIYVQHQ